MIPQRTVFFWQKNNATSKTLYDYIFSLLPSLCKSICMCVYNGTSVWWWNMYPCSFIPQQRSWYRITPLLYFSPSPFFISFFIWLHRERQRERERERGGFLYQPAANFLERFHHPAFGMGWRMGVCVAASTAEDLCALRCVLKLPRTWGCVWGWGLYCGYTSKRGITWPCVFVMISTCASSCVNGLW